jgi:zinc protease
VTDSGGASIAPPPVESPGVRAQGAASNPDRAVFPNGLTLLMSRDRSAAAVAVVTYVKAGYFDESDDEVGIAHVLEHMYFKGTPTRGVGEIARATKATGGYLNAHTIYDHTSYYAVVPAARFEDALAIQADAYANSLIDSAELAREIEVIVQEVRRKHDNPSALATESLYALLYDQHRIRRWRMGQPDRLRTFTRERLAGFYRNFYRPRNTIISVVGDVDPEEVWKAVDREYGGLADVGVVRPSGPEEGEAPPGARYREWSGDIVQSQIVLGWRAAPALHPDTPLLDLAAMVLGAGRGSRLYRALRERQLASTVAAYDYAPAELGVFVVHIESQPRSAGEAARAAWAQLDSLRSDGVGARELERAQRLLESQWVRRKESMEGQAMHLAEWEALGDWSLGERYLDAALGATAAQVTDVVRRYLTISDMGAIVYTPEGSARLASSVSELLTSGASPAPLEAVPISSEPPAVRTRPAAFEREEAGVRVYRTSAGVPILVRQKPGGLMTHAGVFALGGSRDESVANGGLTTLMVRSALKGAGRRSAAQFADALEMLGGSIGAIVGSETFGWSLSVPGRHTTAALDLLADVAQLPTMMPAVVETERTMALADLANLRDDMYRYPIRLATRAAYADHPYGAEVLGSEDSLRSINVEDIRRWHSEKVEQGGAQLVIAVVSGADPDDVAADAARAFGAIKAGAPRTLRPPRWPTAPVSRAEQRNKSQTALALAFPGPTRRDADRTAAQLTVGIASGLGGRFFEELRDRHSLAYTVNVATVERTLGGMFVGYIATSPEREEEARAGLAGQFAVLARDGVTDEELERAQSFAIGIHAIARQSGASLLGELSDAWLLGSGLSELGDFDERVRAVTVDAVSRVARASFDPDRMVEGIVRGTTESRTTESRE